MIFLISASWVARITGMSHQHPAQVFILKNDKIQVFLVQNSSEVRNIYLYLSIFQFTNYFKVSG
jgi:hypothetical protein